MELMQFIPFIQEVLEFSNFNWRVSLGFKPATFNPPSKSRLEWEETWRETDPEQENWTPAPRTAQDCIEKWIDGVEEYLWVEECRGHGEVVFHVLILNSGCDPNAGQQKWREISGGWSKTYDGDDSRIIGLLGHLVMRKHYPIRVHAGIYDGLYTHEEFFPWKPKD